MLYPIGILVLCLYIVWKYREQLHDPKVQERFGMLYAGYEYRCWYYESLELLRKLVLSSVVIFVAPGTVSQIAIGLLVSVASLVLHVGLAANLLRALLWLAAENRG